MISEVKEIIDQRKIESIYHFTTNNGVAGVLGSKSLKSRKRLPETELLEYIVKYNAEGRYDPAWLDYVNLSISRVNSQFFSYCSKWHRDVWWAVLDFCPSILCDSGVYFCTTNNIYPSALRGSGAQGLSSLFNETVFGRYNFRHQRSKDTPPNHTTDIQAEVLYPGEIPISLLKRIIVVDESHQDIVMGQQAALSINPSIPVEVCPEILPKVARA